MSTERERVAWLCRRAGFGPAAGQLDRLEAIGADAVLDLLCPADPPTTAGAAAADDPWPGNGVAEVGDPQSIAATRVVVPWLGAMARTERPFDEWMRWFWHGHFVSTLRVARGGPTMVEQLRMLGRLGLGDVRTLLRAVTVDPAMLLYLDGAHSTATAVNENYGREVLELFTLGIGHYGEADVRAGAEALTGWRVTGGDRSSPEPASARFDPTRHDDRPKTYLGREGVHDVDGVVDAIVAHPACAPFLTAELARALLGPGVDSSLLAGLAADFADSGLQLRPLVRAILRAGLDGATTDLVRSPVSWLIAMARATGVTADDDLAPMLNGLIDAGQLPLDAPNVAGWPSGTAWFSASATVARVNMARLLAVRTPDASPLLDAARRGDLDALADGLGHPAGLGPAVSAAAADVARTDRTGRVVLQFVMASSAVVVA